MKRNQRHRCKYGISKIRMRISRELVAGEHDLIGDIVADSFSDDPVNCWVFATRRAMLPYYTHVARKLYLRHGYGHVMGDASGGTLWLPPGAKSAISLLNSFDIAYSMLKNSGFKSISRGMFIDRLLAGKRPKQQHHYLYAIGTRPQHQGKGVGGALIQAGLERVDSENMPAYLESSKEVNVPFYRKFGFEVIERVVPKNGCPPLWLMWREPKARY